jgi:haloalkane dehalogenase
VTHWLPPPTTETPFAERLRRESLLVPGSPSTPRSTEHHIPRDGYKLFAQEYEGSGPALVLLHGFADNRHIYDRLIPSFVGARRRLVAFDFLGFGDSDKPTNYKYTFEQQTADIRAVVDFLNLDRIVPVAHDAGAVAAIDYVLANPQRITGLFLLNSFYGDCSTLRFPELIAFFANPELKALSHAMLTDPELMAFLLNFQRQQFQADLSQELKDSMDNILQPIINQNFAQHPSAGPAFAQLTGGLNPQLKLNDERLPQLDQVTIPNPQLWGACRRSDLTSSRNRPRAARLTLQAFWK